MAMSIFNEKQIEAMRSGKYICSKCGRVMEFEDEWEDTLVCSCGHNIGLDEYGCEGDEKYKVYIQMKMTAGMKITQREKLMMRFAES